MKFFFPTLGTSLFLIIMVAIEGWGALTDAATRPLLVSAAAIVFLLLWQCGQLIYLYTILMDYEDNNKC